MNINHKLLSEILGLEEHELFNKSIEILSGFGYKPIAKEGDYIFAKGSSPILLVAHMDIVHEKYSKSGTTRLICHDTSNGVYWSPNGLGADDRAGVYGIFNLLSRGLKPSVLLTLGEESGGVGVDAFLKDNKSPPADFKYLIELDKSGASDAALYDCFSDVIFKDYIKSFGWVPVHGSFTDISSIMKEWEICGANFSVGYYKQHTKEEHLFAAQLSMTLDMVEFMLNNLPDNQFKYTPIKISSIYQNDIGMSDDWFRKYKKSSNYKIRKNDSPIITGQQNLNLIKSRPNRGLDFINGYDEKEIDDIQIRLYRKCKACADGVVCNISNLCLDYLNAIDHAEDVRAGLSWDSVNGTYFEDVAGQEIIGDAPFRNNDSKCGTCRTGNCNYCPDWDIDGLMRNF